MGGLRDTLGFDGLVVTDALIMDGALVGRRESDAAVEAVQSGRGLLLYPKDPRAGARRAGRRGGERRAVPASGSDEALAPLRARGRAAHRARLRRCAAGPTNRPAAWPTRCSSRAWCAATRPRLSGPIDLVVVDDDLGGPYPPSPSDYVAKALGERAGRPLHRRVAGRAGLRRAARVEGKGGLRRRVARGARELRVGRRPDRALRPSAGWSSSSLATRRCCWPGTGSG